MTIANVSLFVVIVLSTIGFSLFDFRNLPFKENLKISVTLGLILGIIFYSAAFQAICEHTATKDQIEWTTLPTDKATLTSYQSPNKHYKVIKTLDQVTKDDLHWTGKLNSALITVTSINHSFFQMLPRTQMLKTLSLKIPSSF